MRILIGTIMHESNSFTSSLTTFEEFRPLYGEQLFEYSYWEKESIGGIVNTLKAANVEIIPTIYACPFVSGTIEYEAYQKLKKIMLDCIRNAGVLDGICLGLHGSMFVDGEDDPEGDLMSAIRELVGPHLPITCSLDMHATVTNRLVSSVNGFTVFRTAPHVDMDEAGARAAKMLLKIIRESLDVMTVSVEIPIIIGGEHSETAMFPMRDLIALVLKTDEQSIVLNSDYALGFPWADTQHHCVRALVTGEVENKKELIRISKELASAFWNHRHDFGYSTEAYSLDQALDVALAEPTGPVLISDTGDNPTAGAKGDQTNVLKRLLERKMEKTLVAVIYDLEAYKLCMEAGVGATIDLPLGRDEPRLDSGPLHVTAKIVSIKTGVVDPKLMRSRVDSIVLQIEGVTCIVAKDRVCLYDPGYFELLGIKAADYQIIVIKVGYQSLDFQAIASKSLFALTQGETNIDLPTIKYKNAPRPIFPLDKDIEWSPQELIEQ